MAFDQNAQVPMCSFVSWALFSTPPPNVRIECDDANLGLSQYFPESFDVVHCRCITTGIINYRALLEQIYAVLRPGGVLLTVDCDMLVYSEKQEPISALNENEEVSSRPRCGTSRRTEPRR